MRIRRRLWRAIRRRFPAPGTHPRVWAAFLIPWVLLVAGVATAFASYSLNVAIVDSLSYVGSVGANDSIAAGFNTTGYSYVEFAFQQRPSCSLRVYVLDPAGAERYVTSSILPDPSTSLNCDRQRGVFAHAIALLVFDNPFEGAGLNYSLRAHLYLVTQPYAIWVIPGFALFLGGAIAVAIRMLRSGVTEIVDDLGEDEPIPYWEDEKR